MRLWRCARFVITLVRMRSALKEHKVWYCESCGRHVATPYVAESCQTHHAMLAAAFTRCRMIRSGEEHTSSHSHDYSEFMSMKAALDLKQQALIYRKIEIGMHVVVDNDDGC